MPETAETGCLQGELNLSGRDVFQKRPNPRQKCVNLLRAAPETTVSVINGHFSRPSVISHSLRRWFDLIWELQDCLSVCS